VLGFPSNDFGRQEPGTDAEIGAFCKLNYGVSFPIFSKVSVKGEDVHPIYSFLTSRPKPIGGPVQWNFQKYLIDRDGKVVARYSPGLQPEASKLTDQIERLLSEPANRKAPAPPARRAR
jgi:glutathione peroxidase